jgi:large subunit ribosomal protein L19e
MNLRQKKKISAKILKVGKDRIYFNPERLSEIKESITKQDIRDLYADGAIKINEKRGRAKIEKGNRRRDGSIKKRVSTRKLDYMNKVRKLRKYLTHLKKNNKLEKEDYRKLRIYIKVQQIDSIKKIDKYLEDKK